MTCSVSWALFMIVELGRDSFFFFYSASEFMKEHFFYCVQCFLNRLWPTEYSGFCKEPNVLQCLLCIKAAKYEIQKTSACRATLFRCKYWDDVSRFSPCVINLSRNKNMCCGLKKVVAKSRARVYFEQQILALLLVFHQTHNLSRNKFAHVARQVEGFVSRISSPLACSGWIRYGQYVTFNGSWKTYSKFFKLFNLSTA